MNHPDPEQQPYHYRYPDLPPASASPSAKPPVRVVYHPGPIAPRGIALTCPACAANRNWLVIHYPTATRVSIRCRCTHQWIDPDLTLDDFEQYAHHPAQDFDTVQEIVIATGFDSTFAGTYLD